MTHRQLGTELRNFLRGFLLQDEPSLEVKVNPVMTGYEGAYEPRGLPSYIEPIQPERPKIEDLVFMPNARARLRPGWLLLAVQKDNSVVQFDPDTGATELVCRFLNTPMLLWRAVPLSDGTFYVSLSGTRWPGHPGEVAFGQGGAVLHIDHQNETMALVPGTDDLLDPSELLVSDDGSLVVSDFKGFGGTGAIYRIDVATGNRTEIFSGEPLKEPVALALTPNGLFVANAFMQYSHGLGPGGRRMKEMGALLRLPMNSGVLEEMASTAPEIVHDESTTPMGVIDSIAFETEEYRYAVLSRNDWPTQEGGAMFRLDTQTGEVKTILQNNDADASFIRANSVAPNIAYAADSYGKRMFKVDIRAGEILDTKSLDQILGPTTGMVSPLDTVESIRPIP